MNKQILVLLILFSLFSIKLNAQTKVFILAGQSNMVGSGNIMDLPAELRSPQSSVKIYNAGTGYYPWVTLEPGVGAYKGSFGPEVTFARDISKAFQGETLAIIKIAWSGTSLAYDWLPPSVKNKPGPLYTKFRDHIKKALRTFDSKAQIMGMCWMQGESDASNIYPASDYKQNLLAFIKDVRKDLVFPELPFVIAMIDDSPVWQENAIVRKAQQDVASAIKNVGIFDTAEYATDGSHYYSQGLIEMGEDFASVMLKLINKKPISMRGDVNHNGTIDIVDALLTAQYYVGLNPKNFYTDSSDINCDGKINIVDALLIAQNYVGLLILQPLCKAVT